MSDGADGDPRVVLLTASDLEVGLEFARYLVGQGLAACVNAVPGVTSVYSWDGEVREDSEVLLVVKTRAGRLPAIERALQERHPYDTPECVALAPAHVEARYLQWLLDATAPDGPGGPN